MSNMARAMEVLYRTGRVNLNGMHRAVLAGVITAEDYKEITGQEYV